MPSRDSKVPEGLPAPGRRNSLPVSLSGKVADEKVSKRRRSSSWLTKIHQKEVAQNKEGLNEFVNFSFKNHVDLGQTPNHQTPKPGSNLVTQERLNAILAVRLVGLASTIDQQPADAKSAPSQNPSETPGKTPGKTPQPSPNSQPPFPGGDNDHLNVPPASDTDTASFFTEDDDNNFTEKDPQTPGKTPQPSPNSQPQSPNRQPQSPESDNDHPNVHSPSVTPDTSFGTVFTTDNSLDPQTPGKTPRSRSNNHLGVPLLFSDSKVSRSIEQSSPPPQTPKSNILFPDSPMPVSPLGSANTTVASRSSPNSTTNPPTRMDSTTEKALQQSFCKVTEGLLFQHPNQPIDGNWYRARDNFLTGLFRGVQRRCSESSQDVEDFVQEIIDDPGGLRDVANEFKGSSGEVVHSHHVDFRFGEKLQLVEQIKRNLSNILARENNEKRQKVLSRDTSRLSEEDKIEVHQLQNTIKDKVQLIKQVFEWIQREGTSEGSRLALNESATAEEFQKLLGLYREEEEISQANVSLNGGSCLRVTVDPPSVEDSLSAQPPQDQIQNLNESITDCYQSLEGFGQSNEKSQLMNEIGALDQSLDSVFSFFSGIAESLNHSASFADDSDESNWQPRTTRRGLPASESLSITPIRKSQQPESFFTPNDNPIPTRPREVTPSINIAELLDAAAPAAVPRSAPVSPSAPRRRPRSVPDPASVSRRRPRSRSGSGAQEEQVPRSSSAPGSNSAARRRPRSVPDSASDQKHSKQKNQDPAAAAKKPCKRKTGCGIILVFILIAALVAWWLSTRNKNSKASLQLDVSEIDHWDNEDTLMRTFHLNFSAFNLMGVLEILTNESNTTLTPGNASQVITVPCSLGEADLPPNAVTIIDSQGEAVLPNQWGPFNCQVPLNATVGLSATRLEFLDSIAWLFTPSIDRHFPVGEVALSLNGRHATATPGRGFPNITLQCRSDDKYLPEGFEANFYRQESDSFSTPVAITRKNWVQNHLSCVPTPTPPVAVYLSKVSREDTSTYPLWHFNANLNATAGTDTFVCLTFNHETVILNDSVPQKALDVLCEQGTGDLEENIAAYRSSASDCSIEGEAVPVIPNWAEDTLSCVPTPVNPSATAEIQEDLTMNPRLYVKTSADGWVDPNAQIGVKWSSKIFQDPTVEFTTTWNIATGGVLIHGGQCGAQGGASSTVAVTLNGGEIPANPSSLSFTCQDQPAELDCHVVNSPSMNPGVFCVGTGGAGVDGGSKVEIWWESLCWLSTIDKVFTWQQALAGFQVEGQCVALGPCPSSKVSAQLNGQDLPVDLPTTNFDCSNQQAFFAPNINKAEISAAPMGAEPTIMPLMLLAAAKFMGRWLVGGREEVGQVLAPR